MVLRSRESFLPQIEATIIYLGPPLLTRSSDLPNASQARIVRTVRPNRRYLWSCSRWGLPSKQSPVCFGVSYTPVPPLPVSGTNRIIGGPFLWHFPSTRADWMLSSTLPCGARTFLSLCSLPHDQRLSVKLFNRTAVYQMKLDSSTD